MFKQTSVGGTGKGWFGRWWFGVAVLLLVAAVAQAEPGVEKTGDFAESSGLFDAAGLKRVREYGRAWESWQGDDAKTGTLRYGPFVAGKSLQIFVAGFCGDPGLALRLRAADAQTADSGLQTLVEILTLRPRSHQADRWGLFRWELPAGWRGRMVYLEGEDNSTKSGGWLGFSEPVPEASSWTHLPRMVWWLTILSVALVAPGLVVGAYFTVRRGWGHAHGLAVALCVSGVVAYATFFIYLASPGVGKVFSWCVLVGSGAGLAVLVVGKVWRGCLRAWLVPLGVCWGIGLFYLAAVSLYGGIESPQGLALCRFLPGMPPDPLLPLWLAEAVESGRPVNPFFADWLSSDRPPLQAGFALMIWPVIPGAFGYLVLGVILQTWVFLAAWIVGRMAGLRKNWWTAFLWLGVASGFFLMQSVFVWPKLLPAAFLLLAMGLGFFPANEKSQLTGARGCWVGVCAALAMLGHGGSAFAIFGLGATWLCVRRSVPLRFVSGAAVCGLLTMLPWQWYQKYYDPPGNRLLKWHLAGVDAVDGRGLRQTFVDQYSALSPAQIVEKKGGNFICLLGDNGQFASNLKEAWLDVKRGRTTAALCRATRACREGAFFHFVQTLGVAWLGAWGFLRMRTCASPEDRRFARCAGIAVGCTLIDWCLLMFGGHTTVVHQGTYFAPALAFMVMALGLGWLPAVLRWGVIAVNLAVFAAVWVWSPPHWNANAQGPLMPAMDGTMAAFCAVAVAVVCVVSAWSARRWDDGVAVQSERAGDPLSRSRVDDAVSLD